MAKVERRVVSKRTSPYRGLKMEYSSKGSKFNGSFLDMDEETQQLYVDIVNADNEKYCL